MNALTIICLIVLAVSVALNAVLLPRELKARRARRLFSKLFWETYRMGNEDE